MLISFSHSNAYLNMACVRAAERNAFNGNIIANSITFGWRRYDIIRKCQYKRESKHLMYRTLAIVCVAKNNFRRERCH